MLTLVSEHRIYGCHKLKNQGGKCTQWHGHQYRVILTLKAPYNPTMEEMSKFFYDGLKPKIECLVSVGVYETPETGVTYEPME